jgi:DNA-binding MarR family transcriptional regulator
MATRAAALEGIEVELRAVMRRVKRLIAERASDVHADLQPASYVILNWLAHHGPARGSALAEAFHIDKGAISRQVQHLVDLGLVARTADPEDGRATLVSLTPRAEELLRRADAERRQQWEGRLADWSVTDLQSFAAQLRRFNSDIEGA